MQRDFFTGCFLTREENAALDQWRAAAGVSRSEALREALRHLLSGTAAKQTARRSKPRREASRAAG